MFKQFLAPRATTRTDIGLAVGATIMAIVGLFDVVSQYKTQQAEKAEEKENSK